MPSVSQPEPPMTYDLERAGDLVLALMQLGLHDSARTWKGYDWEVLIFLYEQGCISDPVSKAKSVVLTEQGEARSRAMFEKYLAHVA
jgi:hypothetical protein